MKAVDFTLGVNATFLTTEEIKSKRTFISHIYFFITLEIHVNYMRNAIIERETVTKTVCFPLRARFIGAF